MRTNSRLAARSPARLALAGAATVLLTCSAAVGVQLASGAPFPIAGAAGSRTSIRAASATRDAAAARAARARRVAAGRETLGTSRTPRAKHTGTVSAPTTTVPAPAPTTTTTPVTVPPTTTTSLPAPSSGASGFVTACGTQLCLGASPFGLFGASSLGGLGDPAGRIGLASGAHLDIVRIVNFLDEKSSDVSGAPYDEAKWVRVDREIATAGAAGLHVIVDLSTYRNLLWNNGIDPYTQDWQPFLSFLANRVNTVTGVRYRDDPTIAIIAIAGEVEPLTVSSPTTPTTQQLTDFYRRTIGELHALDPDHLVSSGGLLQIDWNSGIDWKSIFALPGNDVPAIHVYSTNDETKTMPAVAAYAHQLGKPWIIEEFGFPQTLGDTTRAADFQRVFDEASVQQAAGVLFWNIGPEIVGVNGKTQTYDVNPLTPQTYAVVESNRSRW